MSPGAVTIIGAVVNVVLAILKLGVGGLLAWANGTCMRAHAGFVNLLDEPLEARVELVRALLVGPMSGATEENERCPQRLGEHARVAGVHEQVCVARDDEQAEQALPRPLLELAEPRVRHVVRHHRGHLLQHAPDPQEARALGALEGGDILTNSRRLNGMLLAVSTMALLGMDREMRVSGGERDD